MIADDRIRNLGLWAVTAPPPPALAALDGHLTCDVLVIGGGYTGVSAALHLAQAGVKVVLLEANYLGYGGSGRNVGLVNAGLWVLPDDVVRELGPDYGERLNHVLGSSPDLVFALIDKHGISCEAVRNGTLHCAHSPSGYRYLQERERQWGRRGAPVRLLDAEKAAEKIGSRAYHGALWDLRAGTVQPLAYLHGLAHAAVRSGALLYVHSPALAVEKHPGGWRVKTPGGSVSASGIILATNAYTDGILPELKRTFIRFHYFQFATKPLPEAVRKTVLPDRHGTWDTNTVLSSMRLDASGRLIAGSVGTVEDFGYPLHKSWARRMIRKIFPQVGDVDLEYSWYGVIAMTRNHMPRFYELGPGFITVMSYNGRGIGPGTMFGKLMAQYFLHGGKDGIPLPVSRPQSLRTRKAWEVFYEVGARLYHAVQKVVLP